MTTGGDARTFRIDIALIVGLHAALCVAARLAGFDHISDDDFSRVTIAQAFVHAPTLDPSGTSWLPLPFWLLGVPMALFGRSLTVARILSIAFASLAAALPYVALRFSGVPRIRALVATAFAFMTPWSVWVGATTVPESFTASLLAFGATGIAAASTETANDEVLGGRKAPILFGIGILAACLSRYETWPAAAILAVCLAIKAARVDARRPLLVAAAACVLGPLAWMAWNAHAHDGPLHFFRRVASYKQSIGAGTTDAFGALLLYPQLLFTSRPEVAVPALFLLPSAFRNPDTRRRWGVPLLCAVAQVAFLAYGNLRDGAPTHHPERALLGVMLILALFVADVGMTKLAALAEGGQSLLVKAGGSVFAIAWIISSVRGATPPGQGPTEDRSRQIARGEQLRQSGALAVEVTPCAFEHFALIAAFGAPEHVSVTERTTSTPAITTECPGVRQTR